MNGGGGGGGANTEIPPPPDNTLNMPPKFGDTLQIQNINEPGILNSTKYSLKCYESADKRTSQHKKTRLK